jgi:hypothetical protein
VITQAGLEEYTGVFTPEVEAMLRESADLEQHAGRWADAVRVTARQLAVMRATLTVDDIYAANPALPQFPGAGSVLRSLAHEGTLIATDSWVTSTRSIRVRPVRVWRSLVHTGSTS